jgi:hypothetical protein
VTVVPEEAAVPDNKDLANRIAGMTDAAAVEQLQRNAVRLGRGDIASACQNRINVLRMGEWGLDPQAARQREFMHWLVAFVARYEERMARERGTESYSARHTRMALANRGAIPLLSEIVGKPRIGATASLTPAEWAEWSAEAGVMRFAPLFTPVVVAQARARLVAGGVLPQV